MPNGGTYPIGPGAGPGAGIGGVPGGDTPWWQGLTQKPGVKGAGAGIFLTWLLNKVLQTKHETGMRGIQREGIRSQAEMVTPENLYYQAAQPTAQAEESQARQALFSQLMGGVIGPQQLAKGEYMIGQ